MSSVKNVIVGGLFVVGAILVSPIPGIGQYAAFAMFSYGAGKIIGGLTSQRQSVVNRIEGVKFNVRSTQAALPVVYGISRVGLKVLDVRVVDGTDAATPNADPTVIFAGADNDDVLVKVGAFALGSEDGSGIQVVDQIRVYQDGIDVINGPAAFSSAPSATGVSSKYINSLKYILEDGDDAQNTRAELEDALGWGANVNGAGIAYGAFFFFYDEEVWDKGVPQITAQVTGNRVYDPRTSTWINHAASGASSDNPALCVLDYLTSSRYGAGVPYAARDGGTLDFIDEQSFIDAANYCDDLVTIPGALTEKRFKINAVVNTSRIVGANLSEMLATCRGELIWQAGAYRLIISQVTTVAAFELTENNIVGEIRWTRKGSSVPNLIEATFPDAVDGDYVANTVVWPLTGDTTFLDEDNGVENRVEIALPFTTGYYQTLRTVMVLLREARNDVLVSLTAHQSAFTLQVGDVVNVTHEGPGWVQQPFRVKRVSLTPNGLVQLALQQYTVAAYALDSLTAQPSTPTFNLPDPLRTQNLVNFIYERPQSAGIINNRQFWRRELSHEVGGVVRSVEITVGGYLTQPTLDSGSSSPVSSAAYSYHLDTTSFKTAVHLLRGVSALGGGFGGIDGVIALDNTANGVAQDFTGTGFEANKWAVELLSVGTPTGDVTLSIYEDDGAGLPGTLLATSLPVRALVIPSGVDNLITFSFATPGPTPASGRTYHIAVEYSAGTASDYIAVGVDVGGGTALGTSKILNGSWVENGPTDMVHLGYLLGGIGVATDVDGNAIYGISYDEGNEIIGGMGKIDLTFDAFNAAGGAFSDRGSRGRGASHTTKRIPDYDDVGFRTSDLIFRREDTNEIFGAPGAGATDLDMNNVANGFSFAFVASDEYELGQVGLYLRRTASPTGNVVARLYSDTPSESGTVTIADPNGDVLTDSTALFVTNGVVVGDLVVNTTRGEYGTVSSVDSETQLTLLTGGLSANAPWVFGDSFKVSGMPSGLLATSDNVSAASLLTTYPANPPTGILFSTSPVTLTKGAIYWVTVEYSAGDVTNFVSVASQGSDFPSAELNGSWVRGLATTITFRLYSNFLLMRSAHEATPGLNLSTDFNDATGELKWDLDVTGGLGSLNDLTDVTVSAPVSLHHLIYDGSTWANRALLASDIPVLAASKITSGTFSTARIPNLAASKITSGAFDTARIPNLSTSKLTSGILGVVRGGTGLATITAGNIVLGAGSGNLTQLAFGAAGGFVRSDGTAWARATLIAADIPSLPASKITSGVLDVTTIPNLPASRITSGTFVDARIPSLAASKITSGIFSVARGGTGLSTLTAGSILLGQGGSPVSFLAPGASGQVVRSNGTVWSSTALSAADIGAGTFPTGTFVFSGGVVVVRPTVDTGQAAINLYTDPSTSNRWHLAVRGDQYATASEREDMILFINDGAWKRVYEIDFLTQEMTVTQDFRSNGDIISNVP